MPATSADLYRDPAALEHRLRTVQPAVRIVPERHRHRVSRMLADDGAAVTYHPDQPLWVRRDQLIELDVLSPDKLDGDTERLLLIDDPNDRLPDELPDADLLHDCWRMLFRAAILELADSQITGEKWSSDVLARWFDKLGPLADHEIRFVLESDHLIPHDVPLPVVVRTFVAVASDRALFVPHSWSQFFPSLPPAGDVLSAITDILGTNPATLVLSTRPPGTAEKLRSPLSTVFLELGPVRLADDAPGLTQRAKRAATTGNAVRAAILRTRAARGLEGIAGEQAETAARSTLHDGLVNRLAKVLGWDYEKAKEWSRALFPLLKPASIGLWPRAARALFDLQKIATDRERELYTVDPIEWVRTLGRRPLKRPLTRAHSVILLRHLASADYHLDRVRIAASEREPLHLLIREEMHAAEAQIREELGPIIDRVLDEVGFTPQNRPEQVARQKLVAELLDRVCERGYIRLADLRDAISRNQLKMADLSGPSEFLFGDALLKADTRLGEELDGVYRRGEFYLRWIQRFNAAGFGTQIGRWLTRFVAIPFGGAFMTVEFGKYLVHESAKIRRFFADVTPVPPPEPDDVWFRETDLPELPPPLPPPLAPDSAGHGTVFDLDTMMAVFVLGCVYLTLMHSPSARAAVLRVLSQIWHGLRFVFVELPLRAWYSGFVRAVIRHPVSRFVYRYLGTGLIAAVLIGGAMLLFGYGPNAVRKWSGLVFAIVTLIVNTRIGRMVEDRLAEWWSDSWRTIRVNLIPGFLGWVLWGFRWLVSLVERGLYAVDEWLRFREGQSSQSLVLKAILATVWFPIAYLVRFGFNLLLEPQINPVKHFPVVTVSHKLLLPLIPSAADATGLSLETMTVLIGCIPGIFGFIVWELKENWRLYEANRPKALPPAVLGHHGETMRGLLRPGFHSGTVPKLYRWLRQAIRSGELTGRTTVAARYEHELEEMATVVGATATRELVPLMQSAHCWANSSLQVGQVRIGVQAVELQFTVAEFDSPPLRITFEHRDSRIRAWILDRGWLDRLSGEQRKVLGVGLGELAELCAATWDDSVSRIAPDLEGFLEPMPWHDRVAFWESHAKYHQK